MTSALAIDIGGTKIAAAIVQTDGGLSHLHTVPTPSHAGATALLQAIGTLCTQVRAAGRADECDIAAVGVGTAGIVDQQCGVVVNATEGLIP